MLVVLLLAPLARASETVVGFDTLSQGDLVTGQYEAQGLKLGTATALGQTSPGVGDCGSPTVELGTAATPAASGEKYAILPACPAAGPLFKGTYGALLGSARGSLSVEVRNRTVGTPSADVLIVGYDSTDHVVAEGKGEATTEAWNRVTAKLTGSGKISYFLIRTAIATSSSIAIDELRYESAGEETGGGEKEKTGGGVKPGEKPGGGGSPGGGAPGGGLPPPPVAAVVELQTPGPYSGEPIVLSGAGSQPGNAHIISYDWDLNGDGKIDTSTGPNPIVHLILAPGVHTVGLTVTNSNKESSGTRFGLTIPSVTQMIPPADGGEGECQKTYDQGDVHVIAECIQKLHSGGEVIASRQVALDGMELASADGGFGIFKIQTVKRLGVGSTVQLSGSPVNVELLNTPIGDVVLGGRDLESEPITLAFEAFHPPSALKALSSSKLRRARAAGESKTLVMAFAVAHKCGSGNKKAGCCPPQANTSCAELPGSFPLTGQVAVYLNKKGQSLIDVQVGLELTAVNFQATGALEIQADRETGVNLDSLKFTIPEAGLAEIFKVKGASFVYYFPSDPEESKRDSWQAKATITFGPLEQPGLEAELAFKKGQFQSASMVFTAPPGAGVPIYPGVELNKLGASVGVNPLAFGGVLGASIATQLELTLEFKFREATSTELGFFGGQGKLEFKGDQIATLAADVYSDGYTDAKLAIDLHFPFDSKEPVIQVGGSLGFWDEPESGLWQAEGEAYLKLWVISAEVAVLVNNQYAAGCAAAGEFGVQGRYRLSDGNIDGGFFGFKKCSDELKQYKQKPLKKHSGGFVGGESARFLTGQGFPGGFGRGAHSAAQGQGQGQGQGEWAGPRAHGASESEAFTLPGSTPGQELRITSSSGTPIVQITGPGGQVYTTASAPGQLVTTGNEFISAVAPNPHQVLVFLRHPKGGEWQLQSVPGSAPVSKLETAEDVPPATVRAHVARKHGRSYSLAYRIANFVPGMHVRFVERGRDTTHQLGTVSGARGVVKFTPQEGISRPRTVVAYVLNQEGMPRRELMVTRYLAPAAVKAGRPHGVRIVRHGSTALVSWGAASGARAYRIKVRGDDGRVQTFFRKSARRSVQIAGVLSFDAYTATVVAEGGPNLLSGPSATGRLAAVRVKPALRTKRRAAKKKG
jgi:PKD repeat protein